EGDLFRTGAEQLGRGAVEAFDRRLVLLVRLVTAHARLELEVADDSVQHRLRRQRGAGVVEMRHVLAAGRLPASARDVDHAAGITATPAASLAIPLERSRDSLARPLIPLPRRRIDFLRDNGDSGQLLPFEHLECSEAAATTSLGSTTSKSSGFCSRSSSAILPPIKTVSTLPPSFRRTPSLSSTLAPPETSTKGCSTSPSSLPSCSSSCSSSRPA